MNKVLETLLIGLMLTVSASIVCAGPYEDGVAAFKRGDYATALQLIQPLAARGNAAAQNTLGLMYANGQGVPTDYDEAVGLFRLSAAQGYAAAQASLGLMYAHGQGVPQDPDEAVKLYRLGAKHANAQAQNNLGFMYANGQGVPTDYDEAVKLFRLSAAQGYAVAQANLGFMYANGRGVPQDYILSYMWLDVGKTDLADVASKMTPAQIELAQKIAGRCEESHYKQCGKQQDDQISGSEKAVPMQSEGGTYVVPVLINNAITLNFVVDSGAADVSIPADVVRTLMRTGTLTEADFLGEKTYELADGSKIPSQTFRIRSLKVGNKVIENVNGSVASVKGSLLLGQSFLGRLQSWSVDNTKHALIFE